MGRAELRRIIISDHNESRIVDIMEVGGGRSFPMVIGLAKAIRIDRLAKGPTDPQPQGHDLLAGMIGRLDGALQDIVSDGPRDRTDFAKLRILREGRLIEVDSRPGDAIAIALIRDAPIFVA